MKKKWSIILSLIVIAVVLLSALAAPEIMERRETLGITLKVKNATTTEASLQCTRRIGFIAASVDTGRAYHLERQTSKGWERVPDISGDDTAWPMDAMMIPLGISQWKLNYGNLYGELPPGIYRVCKRFYTYREGWGRERSVLLYAQFEIV